MSGTPEALHPRELSLYHQNPRVGNVEAIAASLRAHGQYRPIVVNRGTHTGRKMEVLAGNHTLKAIRDLAESYPSDDRWQKVECWVIDVDDDRATRIVLADNRTTELGTSDDDILAQLLDGIADSAAGLDGTGYDDDDLEYLRGLTDDGSGLAGAVEDVFPSQDYNDDEEPTGSTRDSSAEDAPGSSVALVCPSCGHEWEPDDDDGTIVYPASPAEAGD